MIKPNSALKASQPKPSAVTIALDDEVLNSVLNNDRTIMKLDLQYKQAHRDFANTVSTGKNGALYKRFHALDTVEICLAEKADDEVNNELVNVIKNQFPDKISTFVLKSLAKEPILSKPYIDALEYSLTMFINEFSVKNLTVDGQTFKRIITMNFVTLKITFFDVTFSDLELVEIDPKQNYSIQELSFEFCKGLNDAFDSNFRSIISAIGKNKHLSTNLKTIKFW